MQAELERRRQMGNLRILKTREGLIDFASNDYLGLARSEALKQRVIEKWSAHPGTPSHFGSTGSRLLTGNSAYVHRLEDHIATFHGYGAGLLFNCGYMANCGLLGAMTTEEDVLFFDAHIHASMREGIRLGKAPSLPFRHQCLDHLEQRLKKFLVKGRRFICIESLYSTDGTLAPLKEIYQLAESYQAHLIVDEAHAVGVFGPEGKGLVFREGLAGKIFAQVVTFGKALGIFGAIVLGDGALKQALVNFARPYIYTTALPLPCLLGIEATYALFPPLVKERKQLARLIQTAKLSESPIVSWPVSGNGAATDLVKKLATEGFDVRALLSPTVQRGKECLRICLHAFNEQEDLRRLITLLEENGR
jgi:8-amino-7-oxononanoate synthase